MLTLPRTDVDDPLVGLGALADFAPDGVVELWMAFVVTRSVCKSNLRDGEVGFGVEHIHSPDTFATGQPADQ